MLCKVLFGLLEKNVLDEVHGRLLRRSVKAQMCVGVVSMCTYVCTYSICVCGTCDMVCAVLKAGGRGGPRAPNHNPIKQIEAP